MQMKAWLKYIVCCPLLILCPLIVDATHNRAGEIRIEQIGDCRDLTIRATIVTYTKESSQDADRDSLELCWGDGTCTVVFRSNGPNNRGESLGNNIKKNIYIGTHTYPGRATYTVSMTDPNRIAQIRNVNFPNSVNIPFHLSTTYTFLNPQFEGCNSTPELLQPPIDIACVGQPFIHNPNAFDPDGDSLSYELTVPLQGVGTPVPLYRSLDQVPISPNNNLFINSVTGDILWDAPQDPGEYNLAIHIIEWRNGIPIDTTLRDMQITVERMCDNLPPEVEVPFEEICVIAGDTLEFDVIGTAPIEELQQQVRLQAFGGPFELDFSPATFERNDESFEDQPSVKRFRWITACEHISEQPYSIVFKATDDQAPRNSSEEVGLANLKTVRIKVVGPPPQIIGAESEAGEITIRWEKPYACEETVNDYFKGFSIWRRQGSNPFEVDSCESGLRGRGYTRIAFNQLNMSDDGTSYEFVDRNLERGRTYCYRVLGDFARTSAIGNFSFNPVSSLPSEEICMQLSRDIPLITNVDVLETDVNTGSVFVAWSRPRADDLDTLQNPGPYRYEVMRSAGGTNNFDVVATFDSDTFSESTDTTFIDTNLNTSSVQYFYKIAFYVNGESTPLGETETASSIFLSVSPSDRLNELSWDVQTPWINQSYIIFLLEGTDLISLDTVNTTSYTHRGLENGEEYCYVVESIGTYGITDVIDPIFNTSQESCGIPNDNVSPCPPDLTVSNICDGTTPTLGDEFTNTLTWTNPNESCEDTNDVAGYDIFYASTTDAPFERIGVTTSASTTLFLDELEASIAGCYYITAIDTAGNVSLPSDTVCVDNCPNYELPNAFTPNSDGDNDLFIPYPYRFIESIDLQIFNRWGGLVFETTDPDINWDGSSFNGEDLAEGVYYYSCQVFERRVTGIVPQAELLSGFIHIIKTEK